MALRQRFACSSSQGSEIGLLTQVIPFESATRPVFMRSPAAITVAPKKTPKVHKEYYWKPPPPLQPPKPGLFTVGSPEMEIKTNKDEGFGVFLQRCSLCKKKLQPNKDIYMYGSLGAFCSPGCRYYRIALDGIDTEEVVKAVPTTMASSKRLRGCFCLW